MTETGENAGDQPSKLVMRVRFPSPAPPSVPPAQSLADRTTPYRCYAGVP
jgi:hypothetical protein